ncbi:MAG TPA: sensor domain-containing diguanylate cyclase [Thermoanaerobaculia bacterium]|nr:sensor domain-containing diguanylate cyclase [Thermoanaerobaculia bacterium]
MSDAAPLTYHCVAIDELERLLERRRPSGQAFPVEFNLAENLIEILRKANEFVPSAAGSILLDDPSDHGETGLTFIAAFGEKAEGLVGLSIPADQGVAGLVYRTGEPYLAGDVRHDPNFFAGVDQQTSYQTMSLVAIPIRIEGRVCGVLELINRHRHRAYSEHDRNLLTIFADYISVAVQNVLDGRRAQEIAKRDNLTGLYNDRFLHIALAQAVAASRASSRDLAVLFLDLDFFKRVNDTWGHLAGSQVLREVGDLLRRRILGYESIAARYGGDEFVLVMPGLDLEGAVDLAEEIRTDLLETAFCQEPGDIFPEVLSLRGQTCSIGIATLNQHIAEELSDEKVKSTLLRLADAAMYVAKEIGRNRTAVAGSPVRRRGEVSPLPR